MKSRVFPNKKDLPNISTYNEIIIFHKEDILKLNTANFISYTDFTFFNNGYHISANQPQTFLISSPLFVDPINLTYDTELFLGFSASHQTFDCNYFRGNDN